MRGAVGAAYASAVRNFAALLVPTGVVLVPGAVVAAGLFFGAVGREAVLADDGFRPLFTSSAAVVGTAVAIAVVLVAYAMTLAATTLHAAEIMRARPASAMAAVGAVVRRPVTLLGVAVLQLVLWALPAAAGAAVAGWTDAAWLGYLAGAAAWMVVCWSMLAVPVSMLDGRGAPAGLRRAWSLTARRRSDVSLRLTGGMLAPGLLTAGVVWTSSLLHPTASPLIGGTAIVTAFLLTVPVQASVLAAGALMLTDTDTALVRGRAAAGGGRAWAALALLPVPGLLSGAYLSFNPVGIPTDRVITMVRSPMPVSLHMRGGREPMMTSGGGTVSRQSCAGGGSACGGRQAGLWASTDLPDGTVVTAGWTDGPPPPDARRGENPHAGEQSVLRVLSCTPHRCAADRGAEARLAAAPILERGGYAEDEHAVAVAAAGDGLLIAAMRPGGNATLLRLIRCADTACAHPRSATVARFPMPPPAGATTSGLAVAADARGRPVIAFGDRTGAINVISCDDAACRNPRTVRPVGPSVPPTRDLSPGVHIVVPRTGNPLLTYQDARTGAARLVRCRTPDCGTAEEIEIASHGPAALTLGHDDRPLIAVRHHDTLSLIACHDTACIHREDTEVARSDRSGATVRDLAVDQDGHPAIAWIEPQPEPDIVRYGRLHVTTCARPRCNAG